MNKTQRWILTVSGMVITLACLIFIIRDIDFRHLGGVLYRADLWFALPLLLAYAGFYWIKAIRWRLLLQPLVKTQVREIVPAMMMGFFANNILPAHLGEFVRMILGAKKLNLKNSQVLATILLERVFDMLIIIWLIGFIYLTFPKLPAVFDYLGWAASIVGVLLVLFLILATMQNQLMIHIFNVLGYFLPKQLKQKIMRQIQLGMSGLQAIKTPSLLFNILLSSLLQWFLMAFCIYFSLVAVHIYVDYLISILVLGCIVFAVTLPSAPGFIGIFQVAFLLALKPFGVAENDAVAASLFFHVLTFTSVTLAGFYYMQQMGMKYVDMKNVSNTASPEA